MVPDKFNMVDMGGIDIIAVQGQAVDGLYQRLVDSIALCRYQCLYNWKFAGITIPPSYVECSVSGEYVQINDYVKVDENDVVHIYVPVIGANIVPVSLAINGTFHATGDVDGFNPVTVNVNPPLQQKTVTENGVVTPDSGYYGLSSVIVNVQQASKYAATRVWTHSTGGNNASIDVQEGYYQNEVFTPTGEIINVLYTTVQGTVRTFNQLTLGYGSLRWTVTALEDLNYTGGRLVTGGTVSWLYSETRDYTFISTEVIQ